MNETDRITAIKPAAREIGTELGWEDTNFYARVLKDLRENGMGDETGAYLEGSRYFVYFKKFKKWCRSRFGENPKSKIDEIDELWSLEDFLKQEGVFAMVDFVHRYGSPNGPLNVTMRKLTPRGAGKDYGKSIGIKQIGYRWVVLMPYFKEFLSKNGYLERYYAKKAE